MTKMVDSGRRTLLTGGGAAAALWLSGAGAASATALTAFRQAVAESAAQDEALSEFYRNNDFAGIWTSDSAADAARRAALLEALDQAATHGLPVAAYDLPGLEARMAAVRTQRDLGEIEVELSRVLLRYARDIQTGILTPRKVDPGLVLTVPLRDGAEVLRGFAKASPRGYLRRLAPQAPEYARLMKEKLRLERLLAAGGWGPKVRGGALKPGQSGENVVALRNRLIAMGYMRRTASATYDADMQKAVQLFQVDHGISTDGVAGESTLREINAQVEDRLASILVAMERERWMNMPRGERHVWVNLTDFTAQIREHDKVTFETRAVVGANRADRRTPEFSDQMEVVVANPTWNVPRSISVKEYLPMLKRNPNAAGHLRITDRRGRLVDREAVDWSAYNEHNFPFDMKQPPSSGNALGLVKFLFPNRWNIYLHDTPAKSLFKREVRAFSHGCIRLMDPFDFAYAVLSKQTDDPKGLFKKHLNSRRESPIPVEPALPVHITYRTAFTTAKGRIGYRRDVYGRDGRVFAALKDAGVVLDGVHS
ncbi:L,D-transpeptidase family protein [Frigidibacter sp. ROC022]|uniref:L,D-transpeptidase family protein n=1 Tax=Frigidibacter sp. ROC022 TaxID=2971796 RepID=UPI00215B5FA2|nr:L,D-transpeptidase family protein [Frigidibacter sp. ROC022]MCR8723937.1 L,D-transpeptidase family protein [Frigidibacter sp. ROC022]